MNDVRNLYFINSQGIPRLLGVNVDRSTSGDIMRKFLEAHNFKCYYNRTWDTDSNGRKGTWFDVGSHTEFFFWGVIESE
jgi:hypothetical protein